VESLDACDFEEEGFMDGDVVIGNAIETFNFGMSANLLSNEEANKLPAATNFIKDTNTTPASNPFIPNARGFTPPIDGEAFTLKRGYQLRPSTLRKLNELKTKHPDVNVYLNTVLDAAIFHYYNYIFNENGHFKR
jgi:hypothetical protein